MFLLKSSFGFGLTSSANNYPRFFFLGGLPTTLMLFILTIDSEVFIFLLDRVFSFLMILLDEFLEKFLATSLYSALTNSVWNFLKFSKLISCFLKYLSTLITSDLSLTLL